MTRGLFILVEGLDRAGKSSQCDALVTAIQRTGRSCQLMKFPDRTTVIGKMINAYLTDSSVGISDEAMHLLFSANRWEAVSNILDCLERGVNIVADRYIFSGIAFSAAKEVPGMDIEWCRAPDRGLPLPDVILFLDVSESVAQQRGGYGEERYENQELQRKVRAKFMELRDSTWNVIDANGSMEGVQQQLWDIVHKSLEKPIADKPALFK